jgi:hypothetical protein
LAVGEGVEEREPDRARLGASGDLANDPAGLLLRELRVPELAGGQVQA